MKTVTLLTGGVKSGKSAKALELSAGYAAKTFIATAEAFDDELKQRVARHKTERDHSFTTLEAPLDLAEAMLRADRAGTPLIIIDCLTMWINNLLYHRAITNTEAPEITAFLTTLPRLSSDVVIVTNETNLGFMPIHKSARLYGDILGCVNQKTAALSDKVIFMVSGLPLYLK